MSSVAFLALTLGRWSWSLANLHLVVGKRVCNGTEDCVGYLQAGGTLLLQRAHSGKLDTDYINDREQNLVDLQRLSQNEKLRLWQDLTNDLGKTGAFPSGDAGWTPDGETGLRMSLNLWDTDVAKHASLNGKSELRCAETGDGHFLKSHWQHICRDVLIVDKFSQDAQVKVDLDLPPDQAPYSVKADFNSMDLVVSHQVFEHLRKPTVAISTLRSLLRTGGKLVISTPFLGVQDHGSPNDYFRYTVQAMKLLLTCAGFDIEKLDGFGDRIVGLAYIGLTPGKKLDMSDIAEVCDGRETLCRNKYYANVGAVGVKTSQNKTLAEIHDCIG